MFGKFSIASLKMEPMFTFTIVLNGIFNVKKKKAKKQKHKTIFREENLAHGFREKSNLGMWSLV